MATRRFSPTDGQRSLFSCQCQFGQYQYNPNPVGFQAPKSTSLFPSITEAAKRAEKERKAELHRNETIRQDAFDSLTKARASQGLADTSVSNKNVASSPPSSTIKSLEREAEKAIKDEYRYAKSIADNTYHEGRDTYNMLANDASRLTSNRDVVNNALSSTISPMIAPHKTMVGSAAIAAAGLVATVATVNLAALKSDIYVADCRALGKDIGFAEGRERVTTTINSVTSFASYMGSVKDSKAYERLEVQKAEQVRDQKIAASETKIKDAETRFESQVALYTASRDKEADKFTRNMQDLDRRQKEIENSPAIQKINDRRQEQLTNAVTTYDRKRETIEADKRVALSQIDMSTPIAAAKVREVSATFDKRLSTLEYNHKRDISNINQKFDAQVEQKMAGASTKLAEIAAERKIVMEKHSNAQSTFETRVAGAKAELQTKIDSAKKEAQTARKEFKDAKHEVKSGTKDRSADIKQIAQSDYQAARSAKEYAAAAKTMVFRGGDNAVQLKTAMVANQLQLSEFMVKNLGSSEEKQLVEAYIADRERTGQAAKMGFTTTSNLSSKDQKRAEEVLMKYGFTDMSNTKDIKQSIKVLSQALPKLQEIAQQDRAAWIREKGVVDTLKAERKTLLADGGGTKNLSPADKKKLEALDQKIAAAKKTAAIAKKTADTSAQAVSTAKSQMRQMFRFKETLPQMGKNIKQSLKTYVKQNYKASAHLTASLGGALIALNKMTTQYSRPDAISQAESRFRGQVNQVIKYTNFATKTVSRSAAIGLAATKMVLGVGKLGTKAGKIIASKSFLYTQVSNNLLKLAQEKNALGKIVGGTLRGMNSLNSGAQRLNRGIGTIGKAGFKAGTKIGKTALKAPGTILKIASTSIQDIPDMAVKAATGALIHGGVATASLLARGTIKAGVKVGRIPVRIVSKSGQAIGMQLNKKWVQPAKLAIKDKAVRIGQKASAKALVLRQKAGAGAIRIGKSASAGAARAFNNTIGRTKLWAKTKEVGAKVAKGVKAAGTAVANIVKKIAKPLAKIGAAIASAVAWLASIISAAVTWAIAILSSIVCGLLYAVMSLAMLVLLLVMLLSVLDAIFEFFADLTVQHKILIMHDPSYVMNLGANYRNVELSIVEFFTEESGYTNSSEYQKKMEVNDAPLYYAVFNNSFSWFGWCDDLLVGAGDLFGDVPSNKKDGKDVNYRTSDGTRQKNTDAQTMFETFCNKIKNTDGYVNNSLKTEKTFLETLKSLAKTVWSAILNAFGEKSTFGDPEIEAHDFYAFVRTYDAIGAQYYLGAQDDPLSTPTNYEVSNAKDVLAMMDAIYTMSDGETFEEGAMTRTKALRYLGVGEYQLSAVEIKNKDTKVHKTNSLDNLFWKTHEIDYVYGTSASDIFFHPSNADGVIQTVTVSNSESNKAKLALKKTLAAACDNFSEIEVKYKTTPHPDGCWTTKNGTWGWRYAVGANQKRHPRYEDVTWTYVTSYQQWNSTYQQYETWTQLRCDTRHDGSYCYATICGYITGTTTSGTADVLDHKIYYWSNSYEVFGECKCPKVEAKKTFNYCLGHIALGTNIYVSVAERPDHPTAEPNLFTKAMDLRTETIEVGTLFWTWSEDLNIKAFGSMPPETINPSEEWSDSSLVSLAIGKAMEPIEYYSDDNGGFTRMETKHGERTGGQYLIKMRDSDGLLFHALYFKNNIFYQSDLISGEQKQIEVYDSSWNRRKIDIKQAANGVSYTKFSAG